STENKPLSSFASPFGGLQVKTASANGNSTAAEALGGVSTPAKPFSFNTSTTPAGPPPKNGISGTSLFGNNNATSESKLVGGNLSEPKSLFGKGSSTLFGAPKSVAESKISASSDSLKPSPLISAGLNTTTSAAQSTETSSTFKVPVSSEQTSSVSTSRPDHFQNSSSISTAAPITTSSSSTPFTFSSAVGTKRDAPAPAPAPASTSTTSAENPSNQASDTTKKTAAEVEAEKSVNAPPIGSSTVGPTPQLTRLKNKTMDEIITRWASDLSKCKKEFQEQASKVAAWDRLMVENGEKIQKLYLSTFEAERQNTEIERQLLNVENQQDEVASWLDKYESEIDEMFSRQIGHGELVQGPDQEREKTYKLAEKLTDRLDEMGKNLTSMINAINDASTVLSKTGKADDPLSSIVRVLNNHLTTLQWIDENAEALKSKIEDSQKFGKSMSSNGFKGLESESADYFYRSLMGRK
ncbi:putative nuclear pore glycoprotein p62, partial [Erysiphe neolycopersici]